MQAKDWLDFNLGDPKMPTQNKSVTHTLLIEIGNVALKAAIIIHVHQKNYELLRLHYPKIF